MFRCLDVIRRPVPSARAAAKTCYHRRKEKMLSTSEGWPSHRGPGPRDGNDGRPWIEGCDTGVCRYLTPLPGALFLPILNQSTLSSKTSFILLDRLGPSRQDSP